LHHENLGQSKPGPLWLGEMTIKISKENKKLFFRRILADLAPKPKLLSLRHRLVVRALISPPQLSLSQDNGKHKPLCS